jgi:hypothetical protein
VASASCGQVEQIEGIIAGITPPPPEGPSTVVLVLKALFVVVGWIWVAFEFPPFGQTEPVPAPLPMDKTPTAADHGTIIGPAGIGRAGSKAWRTDATTAPNGAVPGPLGKYPFIVDRTEQAWWPSRPVTETVGFDGRWGPVVAPDPNGRRTGMKIPEFWQMFLVALARS